SLVGAGPRLRLAVSAGEPDVGLRLVDLAAPRAGGDITADSPFCDATRMDAPGRFSPDWEQVGFVSSRSGRFHVLGADRDGSALRSMTHFEDAAVSLGSWSPDGRWLTFDATIRNHTDIYVVALDGGGVRRLSDGTVNAGAPEWSRDGRWIYFSSDRSGSSTIWKMTPEGGSLAQLASEAGFDPRESPDRPTVYFVGQSVGGITTLRRVSTNGGPV